MMSGPKCNVCRRARAGLGLVFIIFGVEWSKFVVSGNFVLFPEGVDDEKLIFFLEKFTSENHVIISFR